MPDHGESREEVLAAEPKASPNPTKKKRTMPDSYTILILILLAVAVVTIVVSFFIPEVTPATFSNVILAPMMGFESAMQVCLFIIILGGFLAIVNETGALESGIITLVNKMKGHELVLIPILMLLFGICGSAYGMLEETVPFFVLLASTMMVAGFDTMVSALIVILGAGAGCLGSTVNPFSVGIATATLTEMGIDVNQGEVIGLGFLLFIVAEAICIFFVMRYAKKVKADKGSTILSLQEQAEAEEAFGKLKEDADSGAFAKKMSGTQKAVLVLFAITFIVMILGFIPWENFGINFFTLGATEGNPGGWSAFLTGAPLGEWYFTECSGWFFLMAIVIGFVSRLGGSKLVKTFLAGASDLVSVALIVALARSISVLMSTTGLDQWVLTSAADALSGVPAMVFAPASYLLYSVLTFLIPSSSGMAAVSMPIMGPLTDSLGFSVEVMVMIFVATHGVILLFTPTNGVLLAGLEISKIKYTTFLKLVMKPILVLFVVMGIILTIAMMLL